MLLILLNKKKEPSPRVVPPTHATTTWPNSAGPVQLSQPARKRSQLDQTTPVRRRTPTAQP